MSTPVELVTSLLATTPRDLEYLDLGDSAQWSDGDRAKVAALLVTAAERGDARAPAALVGVLAPEALGAALSRLLAASQLGVRLAAGEALGRLVQRAVSDHIVPELVAGLADDNQLARAARLMIAVGDLVPLRAATQRTTSERARTQMIKAQWKHHGFDTIPVVWWRGLGLLRWRLELPLPSFRAAAITRFYELVDDRALAIAPELAGTEMPATLARAVTDARDGTGPIDEAALAGAAADAAHADALVVYAATKALDLASPRCLQIVKALSGAVHRDLFALAATSPNASFAAAATTLLGELGPQRT